MNNTYYLRQIYRTVFPGKKTFEEAFAQKRLKVLKIEFITGIMGYAYRDIYNEAQYG